MSGTHALLGREVEVPASTSNLGPGFDALGLALRLYLRLRIEAIEPARPGEITWRFAGPPPRGENLIEKAFHSLAGADRSWPGLRVLVASEVPERSGLGSSAAAIVAGLRLAAMVARPCATGDLLSRATALEGHPDNVSAAILGGLTVSCVDAAGAVHAVSARWPAEWRLVFATPEVTLETRRARAVLPNEVSLATAVHNLQRAALLVQAVHQRHAGVLREALRDQLHQPHRAALVPGLTEALTWSSPGLLGTFLSGAGPTLAAIVSDGADTVCGMFDALYRRLSLACTVRVVEVHQPAT